MSLFVIGFSNDNATFKAWYNILFYQPLFVAVHFVFLNIAWIHVRLSEALLLDMLKLPISYFGFEEKNQSNLFKVAPKSQLYIYIDTDCEAPVRNTHRFLRPFIGAKPMCQNTIGSGQTSPSDRRIWRTHAWRNGIHAALVEVEHQIWLKMIFLTILQGPQHHFSAAFFGCFCPRTFVGLFRLAAF